MSAFWNHSSQGAIIHGLPFMFCSNKIQAIAMGTGFIFGALPDISEWVSRKVFKKDIKHRTHYGGDIDKILRWVPAWGVHTNLIDKYFHQLSETHEFRKNIEWLFGAITIFVIIYFIKLF